MTNDNGIATDTPKPAAPSANGVGVPSPAEDLFSDLAHQAASTYRGVIPRGGELAYFRANFVKLLEDWCSQHAEQVAACYIPRPGRGVDVYVVTRAPHFDFAFASEVADIEGRLLDAGWLTLVSQLPAGSDEAESGYFDPAKAVAVYKPPAPTPAGTRRGRRLGVVPSPPGN